MSRPDREAINTFMSITGVTDDVAVQKLQEHGGDLNAAVNAHFSEGDRSAVRETSVAAPQDDIMDIDDDPIEVAPPRPRRNPLSLVPEIGANPFSLLDQAGANPFSLLDRNFRSGLFGSGSGFGNRAPLVSQPREVREIPIEVKDSGDASGRSAGAPIIEDITETESAHDPDVRGIVIVEDDDDNDISKDLNTRAVQRDSSHEAHFRPSAPVYDDLQDYSNDIEEEMVRAAIEASKREAQTAEQEKALREQGEKVGPFEVDDSTAEVELGKIAASNGRLGTGSSSFQDEAEDVEEQPLIRHRSRQTSSGSMEFANEVGAVEVSPPSNPRQNNIGSHPLPHGNAFPSDEWGGISSEEHDEAVMLEAAMFGGIPEGTGYRFPYAHPQPMRRPPSPSLQAQRLIREQQDDEYLASLAADREKEMRAVEEAEARRLQEEEARKTALEEERRKEEESRRKLKEEQDDEYLASLAADREKEMRAVEEAEARRLQEEEARKTALEEERRKEEESRRKLKEEQEFERLLAAKEASLPHEPAADDENAVTLLVRMPDGTRRGRRFLKYDNLQALFDFIDVGRAVKPGTYRLVRPYPRRAFSDGESGLTLSELGLTSKQEALFLELI